MPPFSESVKNEAPAVKPADDHLGLQRRANTDPNAMARPSDFSLPSAENPSTGSTETTMQHTLTLGSAPPVSLASVTSVTSASASPQTTPDPHVTANSPFAQPTPGPASISGSGEGVPASADGAAQTALPGSTGAGHPNVGVIVGAVLGTLAGLAIIWFVARKAAVLSQKTKKDKRLNPWDKANLLQNMKNEEVHVTTAVNQRYVYPGLVAHSKLERNG